MVKKLLLALLLLCSSTVTAEYTDLNVRFCLAKDDSMTTATHSALMRTLGIDCATLYYKLNAEDNLKHPYDWVRFNYLNAGYDVVLVLLIDDATESTARLGEDTTRKTVLPGNLQKVIDGTYDQAIGALLSAIVRDGRHVTVRLFHEFDGYWFPWGMYAAGNSPQLFMQAMDHVVTLFNTARAPVTIEVNFNRRDGRGAVLGEAETLMPKLATLVHSVAISSYNRGGTSNDHPYERSFAYEFGPAYAKVAGFDFYQGPINVAEVSTAGVLAPRLPWFEAMLKSIYEKFHRVRTVTFFFGQGTASDGSAIDWALDPADYDAFRDLLERYRRTWHQKP